MLVEVFPFFYHASLLWLRFTMLLTRTFGSRRAFLNHSGLLWFQFRMFQRRLFLLLNGASLLWFLINSIRYRLRLCTEIALSMYASCGSGFKRDSSGCWLFK
jgi:hypothetical protein